MVNHALVILFYLIALAVLMLCTKVGRKYKHIIPFFLFLYIFKILIALVLYDNHLTVFSHIKKFSIYDASGYYSLTLELLESSRFFLPDLPWQVANPGYSTMLYWIGIFYTKFLQINNPNYLLFLYFNVFVVSITFFLIMVYLKQKHLLKSKAIMNIAMVLFVFEPTMLAFGSVLEREVLVGLLLFLIFISFMESRWIRFLCLVFLLLLFRKTYIFIIPVITIVYLIYAIFFYFWKKHFVLYLTSILIVFGIAVHIISAMNYRAEYMFFHHAMGNIGSGFGSFIEAMPYTIRVISYGVLGFFSPIPIYPIFKNSYDGFYLFGLLSGLESIFYLCFHLIIINTILRLKKLTVIASGMISRSEAIAHYKIITKAYLFIFILHLVFQGLVYNIRHKVQIIPCLIFLTLYCLQFYNIRQNALCVFFRLKNFVWSCCVIMVLNVVYFVAKVF